MTEGPTTARPVGTPRHPSERARIWLLVALAAGVTSMGLIWRNSSELGWGWTYSPGWCYTSFDYDGWAYTNCSYGSTGLSLQTEIASVHGFGHPARVMLLLTIAAVWIGYRRGNRTLLRLAPAIAAIGLFAYGFTGRPGQLCFAVGLGALIMALHRDGVLGSLRGPREAAVDATPTGRRQPSDRL